ncbi:MAG: alpha/beta fold hydrolase [Cyanobacteria bacterium P01_F01_bin.150]
MNVLLVHGLGRTISSMKSLGKHLKRQGHTVEYFGYVAFAESYDQIVIRLQAHVQSMIDNSIDQTSAQYAIVAHSLGGLLSRSALVDRAIAPPNTLIMLGTPNQSPRAARWAWRLPPFQWFARDCGYKLATPSFYKQLPPPHYPYQIIAGTGGWTGFGSPFGTDINDGLVALNEARIKQNDGVCVQDNPLPVTFPVFHTFMMNDAAVQVAIARFLT